MFRRHIETVLLRMAEQMPVITLIGPRQSGKTTLARAAFPDLPYTSLEAPDVRAEANEDPRRFLRRFGDGAILDEVQRAPDLLSYLQPLVDEDPRPGRFVLTGSQHIVLLDRVSQTLAGRTALFRLLPLTVSELHGRPPLDPSTLDHDPGTIETLDADLWSTVWAGFYPRIHDRGLDPSRWLADYVSLYVERDVREILRVLDIDRFERFLRFAAARTGQELNVSSLAEDAGVTQPTARQWLNALRIGFVATVVPQHHANFGKRLRKRPKLFFHDSGLACYLLGIRDAKTLAAHPLRGAIFETFVAGELLKAFHNRGEDPPLFYWRDATGHEVDFVIDRGNRLIPVEVKAAETMGGHLLDGLRFWGRLQGNENRGGALIHGGNGGSFRDGYAVRPWHLG